jgi:hypothetical protein
MKLTEFTTEVNGVHDEGTKKTKTNEEDVTGSGYRAALRRPQAGDR